MDDDRRKKEALFRYSVLGSLLSRPLRRGELRRGLRELSAKVWEGPDGQPRRIAHKTLEEWLYRYRQEGFDGLLPRTRSDRGKLKALSPEVAHLIVALKREDPGRSAPLILQELTQAGRVRRGQVSVATIQRLLRREGLSGPRRELDRPARYRWQAAAAGQLWQADCLHGPKLFDPSAGRPVRVKVFGLLDDKSRLVPYARGDFPETQAAFLRVFASAILRRGIPSALLVDNHKSFTGSDVQLCCARLNVRLVITRPYDGPSKGKIERWWRTLRARFIDRLDLGKVEILDDFNLRLSAYVAGDYNQHPHASLAGRTPLQVFEEDAEEIRFVDDPADIEAAFVATIERVVRMDSTCQVHGRTIEVPTHLRGRKVQLHYSLLAPGQLWFQDGSTRVPLREVDSEANASRPRTGKKESSPPAEPTGLNPVEALLRRLTRPLERRDDDVA